MNTGQDPGSSTETNELEKEGKNEKDVCDGVVEEGNGVGGGSQLPRNGGEDGSDDGSLESVVEEGLGSIRDSKNVVALSRNNGEGGEGSDEEEGGNDCQLTSNHESWEVLSVSGKEEFTCLLSKKGGSTLRLGELGDGKEGNLHTLQHTDDGHEEEEKEDCKSGGDGGVLDGHGGVTVEKGNEGDSEAES